MSASIGASFLLRWYIGVLLSFAETTGAKKKGGAGAVKNVNGLPIYDNDHFTPCAAWGKKVDRYVRQ